MKVFWRVLAAIVVVLIGLGVLYFDSIRRVMKANSLFDEDKIVHNFSHMDEVMFSARLPASDKPYQWRENKSPLPEKITINERVVSTEAFLTEVDVTALLVIQNGEIVFEDYYQGTTQDDLRISWSIAKSYLSAIFGVAVHDGLIDSIDDPVTKYVPELIGTAYDGATIRNVMNMASGVTFNEDYMDYNSDINRMGRVLAFGWSMDEFATGLFGTSREPGTLRQYVSIDTHVLGMVLRSVTGQSNRDYLYEKLWSKLGVGAEGYYLTDGKGVAFVLGGLNMRSRDYALFGQLMLQNGRWNSRQIIPAKWVRQSTRDSSPEGVDGMPLDYGFQWWVPQDSNGDYFAVGIYGQYIYIDPVSRTVIVKNAANREFMETSPSGQSYMLDNIDMFRALAKHYTLAQ